MDTFPNTAQFSLSSWWPVDTCLRPYSLVLHVRAPVPSQLPAVMCQQGSQRAGLRLPCQRLGIRPLRRWVQFGPPGGTLAPWEEDRAEERESVMTHTILFYGVAIPAQGDPRLGSQRFSSPFSLIKALPPTERSLLRDGDHFVPNSLSLYGWALTSSLIKSMGREWRGDSCLCPTLKLRWDARDPSKNLLPGTQPI